MFKSPCRVRKWEKWYCSKTFSTHDQKLSRKKSSEENKIFTQIKESLHIYIVLILTSFNIGGKSILFRMHHFKPSPFPLFYCQFYVWYCALTAQYLRSNEDLVILTISLGKHPIFDCQKNKRLDIIHILASLLKKHLDLLTYGHSQVS